MLGVHSINEAQLKPLVTRVFLSIVDVLLITVDRRGAGTQLINGTMMLANLSLLWRESDHIRGLVAHRR